MRSPARYSPSVATALRVGTIKELPGESVLRQAAEAERAYREAVANGLAPDKQRTLGYAKIAKLAEAAKALNAAKADTWRKKLEDLRAKVRAEQTDRLGRLHAIEEARTRLAAMSDSERNALIGQAVNDQKHLSSLEIDTLCSFEHVRRSALFGALRKLRGEIEAEPALELTEGRTVAAIVREYENAGSRCEVQVIREDGETGRTWIDIESVCDFSDPR